eukprot:jgi/Bigna1/85722/estExt_fgenesh1_pg.C_50338
MNKEAKAHGSHEGDNGSGLDAGPAGAHPLKSQHRTALTTSPAVSTVTNTISLLAQETLMASVMTLRQGIANLDGCISDASRHSEKLSASAVGFAAKLTNEVDDCLFCLKKESQIPLGIRSPIQTTCACIRALCLKTTSNLVVLQQLTFARAVLETLSGLTKNRKRAHTRTETPKLTPISKAHRPSIEDPPQNVLRSKPTAPSSPTLDSAPATPASRLTGTQEVINTIMDTNYKESEEKLRNRLSTAVEPSIDKDGLPVPISLSSSLQKERKQNSPQLFGEDEGAGARKLQGESTGACVEEAGFEEGEELFDEKFEDLVVRGKKLDLDHAPTSEIKGGSNVTSIRNKPISSPAFKPVHLHFSAEYVQFDDLVIRGTKLDIGRAPSSEVKGGSSSSAQMEAHVVMADLSGVKPIMKFGPAPSRSETQPTTIFKLQSALSDTLFVSINTRKIGRLFQARDADKSGFLDSSGIYAVTCKLWADMRKKFPFLARTCSRKISQGRFEKAFQRADHDSSGVMTLAETESFVKSFLVSLADHDFEDSDVDDMATQGQPLSTVQWTIITAAKLNVESGGKSRSFLFGANVSLNSTAQSDFHMLSSSSAAPETTLDSTKEPNALEYRQQIEWVYGYNGRNGHSNIVYGPGGAIVYPCGRILISFHPKRHTQSFYLEHQATITCIAQANLGKFAGASGVAGTEFAATGEERPGYKGAFARDSRLLASVSAPPSPTITIWNWRKRERMCSVELKGVEAVYDMKWSNTHTPILATVGKQHASIWSYEGNKMLHAPLKPDPANGFTRTSFSSLAFLPKGDVALGCQGAGQVYVVDTGGNCKARASLHQGTVFTMLSVQTLSGWRLITGSKDKTVCVSSLSSGCPFALHRISFCHSVRSLCAIPGVTNDFGGDHFTQEQLRYKNECLVVGTIASDIFWTNALSADDLIEKEDRNPIVCGHFDGEVWGLDVDTNTQDERRSRFVTTGEDNQLIMWDMIKKTAVMRTRISDDQTLPSAPGRIKRRQAGSASSHALALSSRAVALSPNGVHIAVGTNTGKLFIFEAATLKRIECRDLSNVRKVSYSPASPRGSRSRSVPSAIGVLRYSPDSRILAVGMQNAITILCDTKKGYAVKGYLGSHKAPVTHMDWSINGRHLRSVAADHRLCYFDINKDLPHLCVTFLFLSLGPLGESLPLPFIFWDWESPGLGRSNCPSQRAISTRGSSATPLGSLRPASSRNRRICFRAYDVVLSQFGGCLWPVRYTTQGLHLDSEKKDDIATSPSFAETSGSRKSKGVLPAQILCVDVARKKAIIAAGDEEGYVHLVRSPCLEPSAQRKSANAHSVLVGQVRFADSESKILSVGAGDRTIIQWRLENTVEDTQYDGMVERKDRVFGAQQPQTFSLG